jgi:hypothetical protein
MTLVTPQPVVPFDSYTTVDPASGRASAAYLDLADYVAMAVEVTGLEAQTVM